MEHFDNEIDPLLEPLLLKIKIKKGSQYFVKIGDREIPYNSEFNLYIISKNTNQNYSSDFTTKVFYL